MNKYDIIKLQDRPVTIKGVKIIGGELMKKNRGITLIALVITIVILLILSSVAIVTLTGDNGLFSRAKQAKMQTRYKNAKETVEIKIMEIISENIMEDSNDTLLKIYENFANMNDITIEGYYTEKTSKVNEGVESDITKINNLSMIVVSVDEYSEYKFVIEEEGNIKGVLEEGSIIPLVEYESKLGFLTDSGKNWNKQLKNILKRCGLSEEYVESDIINNKDEILEKILSNSDGTKFILDNDNKFLSKITNSEIAMEVLYKTENKKLFMNNKNWFNGLLNKQLNFFDDIAEKISTLSSNNENIIYSSYDSNTYDKYKAFDNNNKTAWLSAEPKGFEFIGYNFQKEIIPYKVDIVNFNLNGYRCKNFCIEGKEKDSNEWNDLTGNLVLLDNDEVQSFIIRDETTIEQIRIKIIDLYGGNGNSLGVAEFQVYSK